MKTNLDLIRPVTCLLLSLLAIPSRAAELTAFEVPRSELNSSLGFSKLKLPDHFVVFAAGAYAGRKLTFAIDQSGHEATRIDVAVHQSYRHKGLATFLLTEAFHSFHRQAITIVQSQATASNAAALGLYKKLGFQQFDQGSVFRKE